MVIVNVVGTPGPVPAKVKAPSPPTAFLWTVMVPGWICVLVNVQSTVCPNRRCAVKLAAARLIVVFRPRSGSTTSEHVMPVLTHPGTGDSVTV